MNIRTFSSADEAAVIELWRRCDLVRPWNDPRKDIQRKLSTQPELFVVGEIAGRLVASVMAGFDGHRGWVNYLAVSHPSIATPALAVRSCAMSRPRFKPVVAPR